MSAITLDAATRSDFGKGASRRLRNQGLIPAIIYGGGKDPVAANLEHRVINKYLNNDAFYSAIINLKVDGKPERAVLRDIQHHPHKSIIMHLDFLRVKSDQELTMNVPLHYLNEETCVGVKEGGSINKIDMEIEIVCLPADLPEYLEVDIAALEIGDSLHISDVQLPEGVRSTVLSQGEDYDRAIVSCHVTRAQSEESDEEEGEDTTAGDAAPEEGSGD